MDSMMTRSNITQTLNAHSDQNECKTKNGLSGQQTNNSHYPHRKVFDDGVEIPDELDIEKEDCNNLRSIFNFNSLKLSMILYSS